MLFIGGRVKRKLPRKRAFLVAGENAARRKSCIAPLEAEILAIYHPRFQHPAKELMTLQVKVAHEA
jgi:hypothetical protein